MKKLSLARERKILSENSMGREAVRVDSQTAGVGNLPSSSF